MQVGRCAAVGAALLALVSSAPRPGEAVAALLAAAAPGQPLTGPLVAAAALLAWALAGWLVLAVVLTAGGRAGGRAGAACRAGLRAVAPATARRAVAVALGLGVVVGVAGPAAAAGDPTPGPSGVAGRHTSTPVGAPAALDWPTAPPTAPPQGGAALDWPAAPAAGEQTVLVRPGDSLWRLAEERLPAPATTAAVAAAWPHWWSANRALLGDDPDLLHPGQRLVVPSTDEQSGQAP